MKPMIIETFSVLARSGSVHRVFLVPYPSVDGGGWVVDVDHRDSELTRRLYTQRLGVRVFKNADVAIRSIRNCGYAGQIVVTAESKPAPADGYATTA